MAIQVRKGLKSDFDPTKMLPGEWAVAVDTDTNNQIIWMCFSAGTVKRMMTVEDAAAQIAEAVENATDDLKATYLQALNEIKTACTASQTAAKTSEDNAKTSETNAAASASTATTKASAASTSATAAANSATAAHTSETNAASSATSASTSASTATTKASQASTSATNAANSATAASNSSSSASTYATSALAYDTESKSYAVGGTGSRTGEDIDNSKYYAEQARIVSGTNAWIDFDANGYLTLYTKED